MQKDVTPFEGKRKEILRGEKKVKQMDFRILGIYRRMRSVRNKLEKQYALQLWGEKKTGDKEVQ